MLASIETLFDGLTITSVFLRLLMAVICGGVIGLERGIKKRPAGLRTYILVCLGSALVMITSEFLVVEYAMSDPTRMGAQVISGIGFLGAGTIIVTRDQQVKGLTTAAGLWATACMGLAIGAGFYSGAIIGTVFIFLVITVLHKLDDKVTSRSKAMEVYVELKQGVLLSDLFGYFHQIDFRVSNFELAKTKYADTSCIAAVIFLRLPVRRPHYEVIDLLHDSEFIEYIEEI